jgi:glycerol kinase
MLIRLAISQAGLSAGQIKAIGITNQRETTVVWDQYSGQPIGNAIVWQCRRTAPLCEEMKAAGWTEKIKARTGLIIDAYFSATNWPGCWKTFLTPVKKRKTAGCCSAPSIAGCCGI